MIQNIETFFIHTIAFTPKAFTIYHTHWIGGRTIHATIALSGVSQGTTPERAGTVGTSIKRWGLFTSPGHQIEVDPPPTPERNEIRIPACTFITFGMTCELAEGIAVGTIYYFS